MRWSRGRGPGHGPRTSTPSDRQGPRLCLSLALCPAEACGACQAWLGLGVEDITDRQRVSLNAAFIAHKAHVEVELAWQVAQYVRALFHAPCPPSAGPAPSDSSGSCP